MGNAFGRLHAIGQRRHQGQPDAALARIHAMRVAGQIAVSYTHLTLPTKRIV